MLVKAQAAEVVLVFLGWELFGVAHLALSTGV
jgi:hypothetical protein